MFLDSTDAAHLLKMTRRALYQAVRRGQVPAYRLGKRRLRFLRADLEGVLRRVEQNQRRQK